MVKADQIELAWAAGFFDGEGHCSSVATGSNYRTLVVSIGQTDVRPLERFRDAVNPYCYNHKPNILGPYTRPSRPMAKPFWEVRVSNMDDSYRVMYALEPYLCQPKVDQMYRSFAFHEEYRSKMKHLSNPNYRTGRTVKLSEDDRMAIIDRYIMGESQSSLAKEYGVNQGYLSTLIRSKGIPSNKGRR